MKTSTLCPAFWQKFCCLLVIVFFGFSTVQSAITVKFSVDLSKQVSQSKFNPATDQVFLRGSFNSWGTTTPMALVSNNVFTAAVSLTDNSFIEYKFFINTAGASNGGYEQSFPVSQNGNRRLISTVNNLVLPTVFFNDADMVLAKTTAHFNFHYTTQEEPVIDDFAQRLEDNVGRILKAVECYIPQKVDIYIYKDLQTLHNATGYYESPDWATGSAWGKTLITILSPVKFDYNASVEVLVHEFVHIANAWKATVPLPSWINEGVATYYTRQRAGKQDIKNLIAAQGSKRTLKQIEDDFSVGGYGYSYTIAYFIAKKFSEHALANFVGNMDYSALGYADKIAFQTAWQQFLDVYTDELTKVNVKFSVDMTGMRNAGKFNPSTDHVFIRGSFNNWGTTNQLSPETGNVYSLTLPLNQYFLYEYKFYTDAANALTLAWEMNLDETIGGNHLLDLGNTAMVLPTKAFKISSLKMVNSLADQSYVWGTAIPITWSSTTVSTIKIDYSDDLGASWKTIAESVPATPSNYSWTAPNITSSNCLIKLSNNADTTTIAVSSPFSIGNPLPIGGPYTVDDNTISLLHFNNNLNNESSLTATALAYNTVTFEPNSDATLGSCVKISNIGTSAFSCMKLPHTAALNLDNNWTIEFWFKVTSWGSGTVAYPTLISKPGLNYYVWIDATNKCLGLGYDFEGGTERVKTPNNSLDLNNWYHITFVKNASNATLNAQLHDSNRKLLSTSTINYNTTHLPKFTTDMLWIGGYNFGSNSQFDGYMDELRISNVVRNSLPTNVAKTSVSKLYTVSPNPSSGLVRINKAGSENATLNVQVLNLSGQVVYRSIVIDDALIDLSHYTRGVYLIKVNDHQQCQTEKLILK